VWYVIAWLVIGFVAGIFEGIGTPMTLRDHARNAVVLPFCVLLFIIGAVCCGLFIAYTGLRKHSNAVPSKTPKG
jgi:uncharacterized membrane protein YoaK (UPF0700 family)